LANCTEYNKGNLWRKAAKRGAAISEEMLIV
jgi:hypothetical protein